MGETDRGRAAIGRLRQALIDAAHDLDALEGALIQARQEPGGELHALRLALAESRARNNQVICSWCGHIEQFEPDTAWADRVKAIRKHAESCTSRPDCQLAAACGDDA